MARGIAKMMGFHLMLNFNNPYLATGLGDFWTRWHISLSTWFNDYVYFPLGGSRRRHVPHLPQYVHHVRGLGHLARRGLDVRDLGRLHALGLCSRASWSDPPFIASASRAWSSSWRLRLCLFHLDFLPRRSSRRPPDRLAASYRPPGTARTCRR